MMDAKLKGEGIDLQEETPADRGNVIDLMAALKKSLGQTADAPKAAAKAAAAKPAKEPALSGGKKGN